MEKNDNIPVAQQEIESHEEILSLEEIESAYLQALETAEAAEALFPESDLNDPETDTSESESDSESPTSNDDMHAEHALNDVPTQDASESTDESSREINQPSEPKATIRQVIESLLFVGEHPIPARKFAEILGGTTGPEEVGEQIEELNTCYSAENRPYEIRLVEGGYRMVLNSEFELVRSRVYGQGPKEVKLSQEALEILALIAYRQPASRRDIEESGKKKAGGMIRQLLRRQLIALERGDGMDDESYCTTDRFLELFGLTSIDDLPRAEDFSFR